MTDMSKKTMKLALEALETCGGHFEQEFDLIKVDEAITALREALTSVPDWASEAIEQPAQQEPVADEVRCPKCGYLTKHTEHIGCLRKQLNAINAFEQRNFAIVNMDKFPPAQRNPLTEAQINAFFEGMEPNNGFWLSFARAIEAAHGIKENA